MNHSMVEAAVKNFKKITVLVVGDIMLDKYTLGEVSRVSPEAPVLVLKHQADWFTLGGAGNVANNLASLGAHVILAGVIGRDFYGKTLKGILKKKKITTQYLVTDPYRPTTIKNRLVSPSQQLLRLDTEQVHNLDKPLEKSLLSLVVKGIKSADIVILADYAKGIFSKNLAQKTIKIAKKHNKKIIADIKITNHRHFIGVDVITPNIREAREITGLHDLVEVGKKLVDFYNTEIAITRGGEGISLFLKNKKHIYLPTQPVEVLDVSGAGDTVTAIIALSLAVGLNLETAATLGNIGGRIVVQKPRTSIVLEEELLLALQKQNNTENTETARNVASKIYSREKLIKIVKKLRKSGKKIGLTNGVFDILHAGHVLSLEQSKKLCDVLIVSLNTDSSTKRNKGSKRPIVSQEDRAMVVAGLESVDYVTFHNEKIMKKSLETFWPDYYIKGNDYRLEDLANKDAPPRWKGKIKLIPLIKGKSTSNVIEKILRVYEK